MQHIVITGATGHLGKEVVDFLLKNNYPASHISVLVRNVEKAAGLQEKGVQVKQGDYDHYESLVHAFKGADKLLLVSGTDLAKRGEQQRRAVDAAKEAGVQHILYTSFVRKNEDASSPLAMIAASHLQTEQDIKASGLSYTILKNALYADALPMFFGDKVMETGIVLPAGEGRAAYTTRSDMAEATAHILAGEGHENKTYTLANTANYTLYEAAAALSRIAGKDIPYTSPSKEDYIERLAQAGLPPEYAGFYAGFGDAIRQEEFYTEQSDLEGFLGRKPVTLAAFLESVYAARS